MEREREGVVARSHNICTCIYILRCSGCGSSQWQCGGRNHHHRDDQRKPEQLFA